MTKPENPHGVLTQQGFLADLQESSIGGPTALIRENRDNRESMPREKIEKALKQFPWIRRLIPVRKIAEIYVSGINPEMIVIPIGEESWFESWFAGSERVFLIDDNGKPFSWPRRGLLKLISTRTIERGSTIQAALARLGSKAERVRYILSYHGSTRVAIVYKRPKEAELRKWIENRPES
jgi:hypothetical protein